MAGNKVEIQNATAIFSICWLVAANTVGILLAAMLIWPSINNVISPMTYGRWMPLHMDWQLYGWCSLPLLGLLLKWYFETADKGGSSAKWCFSFWSFGLAIAGIQWLAGGVSGKLFLNWVGFSGLLYGSALLTIILVLAANWISNARRAKPIEGSLLKYRIQGLVLILLLGIPLSLMALSDPTTYPPVNPDSGGATGHSLLLSTLSLVALMALLPQFLLSLEVCNKRRFKRTCLIFGGYFTISILSYLLIEHGSVSNRSANQIYGLGTLLVWPLMLWLLWREYKWSDSSKWWRRAFFLWWAVLSIDGWGIFLPGVLDTLKFTNALVGHSHIAMGGLVSALNFIVLIEMGPSKLIREKLSRKAPLILWNLCCFAFALFMTVQGWREGREPNVLFQANHLTNNLYLIRFVAGLGMLVSSVIWILNILPLRLLSTNISIKRLTRIKERELDYRDFRTSNKEIETVLW